MRCTHNIDPLWFKVTALHNISSAENRFFSLLRRALLCLALLTHLELARESQRKRSSNAKTERSSSSKRKKTRKNAVLKLLTHLVPRAREVEKRVNKKASINCQSLHYSFALLLQTVLVRRIYLDRAKMFAICIFALLVFSPVFVVVVQFSVLIVVVDTPKTESLGIS